MNNMITDKLYSEDDVVITGERDIEVARVLTVRVALKLEIRGLRRSGRGSRTRSARVLANEITGHNAQTREIAYDLLNAYIVASLGPEFNRPRTL